MANKQVRMEKKDWEHQCSLISHNMLLKKYIQFVYEKITQHVFLCFYVFCRFLDQIRLKKTVFLDLHEKNVSLI